MSEYQHTGLKDHQRPSDVVTFEPPFSLSSDYRHAPSEMRITPTNALDFGKNDLKWARQIRFRIAGKL